MASVRFFFRHLISRQFPSSFRSRVAIKMHPTDEGGKKTAQGRGGNLFLNVPKKTGRMSRDLRFNRLKKVPAIVIFLPRACLPRANGAPKKLRPILLYCTAIRPAHFYGPLGHGPTQDGCSLGRHRPWPARLPICQMGGGLLPLPLLFSNTKISPPPPSSKFH